jgi:hypothetical protein
MKVIAAACQSPQSLKPLQISYLKCKMNSASEVMRCNPAVGENSQIPRARIKLIRSKEVA